MKKVISLFKRDYEVTRLVYDEVVPGAEWVINGEGEATVKIDGTSCLVRDGKLYKRHDAKKGKQPPVGFEPAQDPDPVTGHWPGWLLIGDKPEDKWHIEAWEKSGRNLPNGTYELVGPHVRHTKDAPYDFNEHILIRHGEWLFNNDNQPPRNFDGLKAWFEINEVEGIVWHHPNGDMVKIKRRDFGLPWPCKKSA